MLPPRIAALVAVVFWGISFVATKAALREMLPTTLIFARFALGTGLLFAILLSTINWAIYSVLGHATTGAMLFGWLMLAPFFLVNQGWRELANISFAGWMALAFLGIGCSGLGYLFWYGALERIEVSRVAAFLYVEPLVTLLAAGLLLHEPITAVTVMGGCLVLLSVFIVQKTPKLSEG